MSAPRFLELEKISVLFTGAPVASAGKRLAPSPPRRTIAGHFGLLRRAPLDALLELRESLGPVARLQLGTLTAHLVGTPALCQAVLQDRARDYDKETRGTQGVRLLLGNGLLTNEGESWRRHRRIAQPAFHRRRVEPLARTMAEEARAMTDRWDDGSVIDVHAEIATLTLRTAARALFGADVRSDEQTTVTEAVDNLTADFDKRVLRPFQPLPPWPTPANLRFARHRGALDRVVRGIIARRRRADAEATDLLARLVEAVDEETGTRLDDDQLRDEVLTILLAGHETMTNALAWASYLLALHPETARRLEAEVDAVIGDATPGVEHLSRLTYADQVFREALRLYPPVWMMSRRAPAEDDSLGGYHIPARSLVLVSPWVIHRSPEVWDDPSTFDPERFAPGWELRHPRFAFFPFGGGPRICIGLGFALQEAKLVLATIARRARLTPIPGLRVAPQTAVTLRPKDPIWMRVDRRASAASA